MSYNFHETEMGNIFYKRDIPKIAKSLEKIATNLETICEDMDKDNFQVIYTWKYTKNEKPDSSRAFDYIKRFNNFSLRILLQTSRQMV